MKAGTDAIYDTTGKRYIYGRTFSTICKQFFFNYIHNNTWPQADRFLKELIVHGCLPENVGFHVRSNFS